MNRSYPEGKRLLLWISTERVTLAELINQSKPPKEIAEQADKKERTHREGHENWAGSVKTFQGPAMLKTTPLGCERKRPESEEARPVALANASSKAVADQCRRVKTRKKSQTCLDLVCRPVAQPSAEAS
jgi:hypothetical protein